MFVVLIIQHAIGTNHIVILWSARLYSIFPPYNKRHDFRKGYWT